MTSTLDTVTTPAPDAPAAEPVPAVTSTPPPPPAPFPAPAEDEPAPVVDPAELARQAEDAYRDSLTAGNPLSGRELGDRHGRSERWGRERIAAVRASGKGTTKPRTGTTRRKAAPAKTTAKTVAPAGPSGTAEPAETPAEPVPLLRPEPAPTEARSGPETAAETAAVSQPRKRGWLVLLLALPAFVAIWGGWVGLGELTGFGKVNLLPGFGDGLVLNTAITLPIGVEAYAAYALRVWLSNTIRSARARRFAMVSAIGSLLLGMAGQVAYHLMKAAGITTAPWPITAFVACLPVVVLGCGAALAHLIAHDRPDTEENQP